MNLKKSHSKNNYNFVSKSIIITPTDNLRQFYRNTPPPVRRHFGLTNFVIKMLKTSPNLNKSG